jgi:hypothetical protein
MAERVKPVACHAVVVPLFVLALLPSFAFASNYAECILEAVPGVENDPAAYAAHQVCLSKFPGGLQAVKQGAGRGFFAYDSGAECTLKEAGGTRSQRGAAMISASCRRLYDEPAPDWERGIITPPAH